MGRSRTEAAALNMDEDVERLVSAGISRLNEDYVALPGSSSTAAEIKSLKALGRTFQWRKRSIIRAFRVSCFAAVLLVCAAFVSSNSRLQRSGGGLIQDSSDGDGENDFYKASHTGYHFQPEKNWMNDPNAPMFYKGYYHLFYQSNPDDAIWVASKMVWGHAVSTDLIHWHYLDDALMPDQWYDIEGVWSGSATILQDGTPAILYTGRRNREDGEIIQSQSLALPVDPSDPLLRKWKKVDINPIIEPPADFLPDDFRDPTTAWLEEDGFWRLVVGAKKENANGSKDGMALLYKSADFTHWELEEKYLHEVPGSGMWECVDFFPVSTQGKARLNQTVSTAGRYDGTHKYVLKSSLMASVHDFYAIGTYSTETHTFIVDDPALDMGRGPRQDYGKFYASKTFYDSNTGRQILWAWSNESDSVQDDVTKGWASVQTIPRTQWLDGLTSKNLLQWPVEEVEALRGAKSSHKNIELLPADVLRVQGGDGPQLDILVAFEKPDVGSVGELTPDSVQFDCSQGGSAHRGTFGPFGLLVHADDALSEHTGVFFYIYPLNDGQWATLVCSDQSRSSLALNLDKTVYGTSVTVLQTENELSLRILLDHSILESFVQGGRVTITSRVYPTVALGSNSHLFLFNNGTTPIRVNSLDVYQMSTVEMTRF